MQVFLFIGWWLCCLLALEGNVRKVYVVANAEDPDSREIASYYRQLRSIPEENLIFLPLPTEESIPWSRFVREVYNPLLQRLLASDAIMAVTSNQQDFAGRLQPTVLRHNIDYLVLCRGVPLRVMQDEAASPEEEELMAELMRRMFSSLTEQTWQEMKQRFFHATASVDAELALLPSGEVFPRYGMVPNPLYKLANPPLRLRQKILKVTRLDGPSAEAVKGMLDSAIRGEQQGLWGRAYVDQDGRTSEGYVLGNVWLQGVEKTIRRLGYPLSSDTTPAVFPATFRMDAPALYFGWWTWNLEGPFTLPGFRFPPGAIAVHLHSFSAETLRKFPGQPDARWCGPLVALGVACTLGNVDEPYLQLTHNLDLFLEILAEGSSFGDAAYAALPVLSWKAVSIGDPLYRPFVCLGESRQKTEARNQYEVLRVWQTLVNQNKGEEGFRRALAASEKIQGLALNLELAKALVMRNDLEAARNLLRPVLQPATLTTDEWLLACETASFMARELARPGESLSLFRKLLDSKQLPVELEKRILTEAIAAASAAKAKEEESVWRKRMVQISGPIP